MLTISLLRPAIRLAQPGEASLISYLRQAALWCLDMPERSPSTIATFLDRVPDVDPALIGAGRYFVADSRREIVGGVGWSPFSAETRVSLFGDHGAVSPAAQDEAQSGPAVLVRGFFLQDRKNIASAILLVAALESDAARAGFGSAEVIAPAALQDTFCKLGFRTHVRVELPAGNETVPLVHMRKRFSSAFSDAA